MIKIKRRAIANFQGKYYVFEVLLEYSNPKDSLNPMSLKQTVILEGCENPSESEEKAIKEKTALHYFGREGVKDIVNFNYINLRNTHLFESLRKHPGIYLHSKIPIPYEQRLA